MVKTKVTVGGLEATVEGTPEEVEATVKRVLTAILENEKGLSAVLDTKSLLAGLKKPKKRLGPAETIKFLIERGFFDSPKEMIDIKSAFKFLDEFYPDTTIGGTLSKFANRKKIRKIGKRGSYSWVK